MEKKLYMMPLVKVTELVGEETILAGSGVEAPKATFSDNEADEINTGYADSKQGLFIFED